MPALRVVVDAYRTIRSGFCMPSESFVCSLDELLSRSNDFVRLGLIDDVMQNERVKRLLPGVHAYVVRTTSASSRDEMQDHGAIAADTTSCSVATDATATAS